MIKKLLSVFLTTLLIILSALFGAKSATEYDLSILNNCRTLFTYNGNNCAYIYGYTHDTLYSSKVLPNTDTKYITVNGLIYSVTHDENNAYALYERSRNQFSIVAMNMKNGNCSYYDIGTQKYILYTSFAVSNNEIFIICNGSAYAYIVGYDKNGVRKYKYEFDENVDKIFINNSTPYAKLYNGDIYKIGSGKYSFCANIGYCDKFSDAGKGYVYTENNNFVSLNSNTSINQDGIKLYQIVKSGSKTYYINDNGVNSSDGGIFKCSGAKMLLTANGKIAILDNNSTCYVADITELYENKTIIKNDNRDISNDNVESLGNTYWIKNGILYGVESGTTVAQIKSNISGNIKIYDEKGNNIKNGKVKTGYRLYFSGKNYDIAVRGDVTGEGNLNTRDINSIMKTFVGLNKLNGAFYASADFNYDGEVDNRDLVLIAQKYEREK